MLKNIKEYYENEIEKLKRKVESLESKPRLAIFQIGDNEASNRYVRNKVKDCEKVGISATVYKYTEDSAMSEIVTKIRELNNKSAIIVQLPLPDKFKNLPNYISTYSDVDGLTKDHIFEPCTPLGIINYLDYCGFDLDGKNVTIIGRSNLVGKPLARMMDERNATVSLLHSHTKSIYDYTNFADLVVCAVGKPNFLDPYIVNRDAPIIDVGINFTKSGKLVGDVDFSWSHEVTPVPGGVGLLTRLALLNNVIGSHLYCTVYSNFKY